MEEKILFCDSPVGRLGLVEAGGALTRVFFSPARSSGAGGATPLLRRAAAQLAEYFAGRRRSFDLPLAPRGTDFQLAIWLAMRDIPFGETRTYRQLATQAGRPRAARAAGQASRRNPLAIIVPCHRVIGADGRLTGYAGGLEVKEFLLDLERRGRGPERRKRAERGGN